MTTNTHNINITKTKFSCEYKIWLKVLLIKFRILLFQKGAGDQKKMPELTLPLSIAGWVLLQSIVTIKKQKKLNLKDSIQFKKINITLRGRWAIKWVIFLKKIINFSKLKL